MDGRQVELVERYLDMARRAAAMMYPRVRGHLAFEELVALANAGLAEAAARYDPARGVAFPTFAWYRIQGTMLDGLRGASLWRSLDALRATGFDPAGEAPGPAHGLDLARSALRLRDAVARLPDKQRQIVRMRYWEGKNLVEAGAELGLSKSWASRLHAQAVAQLRALLGEG